MLGNLSSATEDSGRLLALPAWWLARIHAATSCKHYVQGQSDGKFNNVDPKNGNFWLTIRSPLNRFPIVVLGPP
jgi:hypothetical protein